METLQKAHPATPLILMELARNRTSNDKLLRGPEFPRGLNKETLNKEPSLSQDWLNTVLVAHGINRPQVFGFCVHIICMLSSTRIIIIVFKSLRTQAQRLHLLTRGH